MYDIFLLNVTFKCNYHVKSCMLLKITVLVVVFISFYAFQRFFLLLLY